MKFFLAILTVFMPWKIKYFIFKKYFKYNVDKSCRIGFSFIFLDHLSMANGAVIGHLNVIKGLFLLEIGESSSIGNLNWISGFPLKSDSVHFATELNRFPALCIGKHSAITNRHLIDCTSKITIGDFSTFAGFRSQMLTHSINLYLSKQESSEIIIGDYCFVGTNSILLKGTSLPSYSILGANSTLTKKFTTEYCLYAGNPAVIKKNLKQDMSYFNRKIGFVY